MGEVDVVARLGTSTPLVARCGTQYEGASIAEFRLYSCATGALTTHIVESLIPNLYDQEDCTPGEWRINGLRLDRDASRALP